MFNKKRIAKLEEAVNQAHERISALESAMQEAHSHVEHKAVLYGLLGVIVGVLPEIMRIILEAIGR